MTHHPQWATPVEVRLQCNSVSQLVFFCFFFHTSCSQLGWTILRNWWKQHGIVGVVEVSLYCGILMPGGCIHWWHNDFSSSSWKTKGKTLVPGKTGEAGLSVGVHKHVIMCSHVCVHCNMRHVPFAWRVGRSSYYNVLQACEMHCCSGHLLK